MLIVIPTYNERANLIELLPQLRRTVPDADVLVVDDNSGDGTARLVQTMGAGDPKIMLLSRPAKDGYGKAITAGFEWGLARTYDHILQMDADLSHHPRYLPAIIEASQRAELVLGSRYVPGGGTRNWSLMRRVLSKGGNAYARTILRLRVHDLTGGYRCWHRSLLERIDLPSITATGYSFMIESLYRAVRLEAKVAEVPIIFVDRTQGESKMSKRIIQEAVFMVWQIRRRTAG
jgi:dolichol-phosphate mannosyltransferase